MKMIQTFDVPPVAVGMLPGLRPKDWPTERHTWSGHTPREARAEKDRRNHDAAERRRQAQRGAQVGANEAVAEPTPSRPRSFSALASQHYSGAASDSEATPIATSPRGGVQ